MNLPEMRELVACVDFRDWDIDVLQDGTRPYLQVSFQAEDNYDIDTEIRLQSGRKWFLSRYMTRSEIVQTAFKAIISAVEHEAREEFTYKGVAIYGPHFDVEALHELASSGGLDIR